MPVTREQTDLTALSARPQNAYEIIMRAVADPACDPSKLRELLNVKQQWEQDEARKSFARDMATFQAQCPIVLKGDDAYGKQYARIDRIHRAIRPLLKDCGFWVTWAVCEVTAEAVLLEGTLGHRDGHTMSLKQTVPMPDTLKGQNATQRAGSAQTYAKRYGECAALGIVTGNDDDGNAGVGAKQAVTQEQYAILRELCEESGADVARFCKAFKAASLEAFPAIEFDKGVAGLKEKLAQKQKGAA
jgi:hypothetical protein